MCCIPEQTNLFSDGAFGKGLLLDCQFNQCLNWTNYGRMRQKRKNQVWIWIALCRKTRQVVARAIGDRSEQTCRELWIMFQTSIVKDIVLRTFGKRIRQSFQKSN